LKVRPKIHDILTDLRNHLTNDQQGLEKLEELVAAHDQVLREGQIWPHVQAYNAAIASVLGHSCAAPTYFLHSSWSFDHPTGELHNQNLAEVFVAFELGLIKHIRDNNVEGDIVEFGIYQGSMLGKLLDHAEAIGLRRQFYGFDSFEGLSEPSPENDYDSWKKGQYAAGYDPEAQAIEKIAYARIDVDIYDPTVDCLNFLTGRLTDRSVLVFDDWAYTAEKGESRAFFEWQSRTPQYRFEWLGQCSSRFYLRVHHR
jgi:hypothetical protein